MLSSDLGQALRGRALRWAGQEENQQFGHLGLSRGGLNRRGPEKYTRRKIGVTQETSSVTASPVITNSSIRISAP